MGPEQAAQASICCFRPESALCNHASPSSGTQQAIRCPHPHLYLLLGSNTLARRTETTVPKPAVPNPHQAAKFLGGVTAEGTKHWLTDEERKLSPERQTMLITERKRQNQKVTTCGIACRVSEQNAAIVQKRYAAVWPTAYRPRPFIQLPAFPSPCIQRSCAIQIACISK